VCAEIVNELPLAQPTVSQHLKELKTGAYKSNFEGNAICYCLDEEGFNKIRGFSAHKYVFRK
jgi:arginine repressor